MAVRTYRNESAYRRSWPGIVLGDEHATRTGVVHREREPDEVAEDEEITERSGPALELDPGETVDLDDAWLPEDFDDPNLRPVASKRERQAEPPKKDAQAAAAVASVTEEETKP